MTDADRLVLDLLLRDIERYPRLGHERMLTLARRKQNGDREAWRLLVQHNLRLVVAVASRYRQQLPLADAIQEGSVGLMRAVDKYDPDRGFALSTYAVWWIRQAIQRAEQDRLRMIRLPHAKEVALARLRREEHQRELRGLPPLSDQEWQERTGWSADTVHRLRCLQQSHLSLNAPLGGDGAVSLLDLHPDPSPDAQQRAEEGLQRRQLLRALAALPERQQRVLVARFGLDGHEPRSLSAIARSLRVSKERARQLSEAGLKHLRQGAHAEALAAWLDPLDPDRFKDEEPA